MSIRRVAAAVAGVATLGALLVAPSAQGAGAVRASVSLAAPAASTFGSTIKFSGTVRRTGTSAKLSGAVVYLQRSAHGKNRYSTLASTRSSRSGIFAFSVKQTARYDYRAYYPGSATYTRAFSLVRSPTVNQLVLLDSITTTDPGSGELRAVGRVFPAPPNGSGVYLQRYSTDAKVWVNVAAGTTSSGRVTIDVERPGSKDRYRMLALARSSYGTGISTAKLFSHYVYRRALAKPLQTTTTTVPGTVTRNPGGSLAISLSAVSGAVHIYPDIANCISARATSNLFPVQPVTLFLTTDKVSKSIKIQGGGGGQYTQDVDLTGASWLRYSAFSEAAIKYEAYLDLRCAD
ncbi:hypothetical protein [Kribbella ginsengisoli]|uniref:Carboxypeptidase regulatory-like domain-containing protein n=1 Tax=Kribbella ginsengisoli TaxID=363865 RepID=A0ABP6Z8F3_9ACTN